MARIQSEENEGLSLRMMAPQSGPPPHGTAVCMLLVIGSCVLCLGMAGSQLPMQSDGPPRIDIRVEPVAIPIAAGRVTDFTFAHCILEKRTEVTQLFEMHIRLEPSALFEPVPVLPVAHLADDVTTLRLPLRFATNPWKALGVTPRYHVQVMCDGKAIAEATGEIKVDRSLNAALEHLDDVEMAQRGTGKVPIAILLRRAELLLDSGRPVAADRALDAVQGHLEDDAARQSADSAPEDVALLWLLRGRVHRHYVNHGVGHVERSRTLFRDALRVARGKPGLECRVLLAQLTANLDRARVATPSVNRHQQLEQAVKIGRRARVAAQVSEEDALMGRADAAWAEVALEKGWSSEARQYARRAADGANPDVRWRGERVLGRLAERENQWQQALEHHTRAVTLVESVREGVRHRDGDGGFVAVRSDLYRDAVHAALYTGDATRALFLVELARARTVEPAPRLEAVERLGERLLAGESLLVHYDTGRGVGAWVVTRNGIHGQLTPTKSRDLVASIGKLRQRRGGDAVESERLDDALLGPVRDHLSGSRLYLAPYGVFRWVPYDALFDGRDFLVEHYTISTLPSCLSFLRAPGIAGSVPPGPLLALLDPDTDYDRDGRPDRPGLPHAEDGIEGFAQLMPGSTVLRGALATEAGFRANANFSAYLHLACHGEHEELRPWESSLLLATGGGHDGRLRARELRHLSLASAHLVCLSGCETALAEVRAADDLAGFPRAVLSSGARRLLGSLWKVEDRKAGAFMKRFYRHLGKGRTPARALREARLESLRSEDDSAPEHWGAWILLEKEVIPEPPILDEDSGKKGRR